MTDSKHIVFTGDNVSISVLRSVFRLACNITWKQ